MERARRGNWKKVFSSKAENGKRYIRLFEGRFQRSHTTEKKRENVADPSLAHIWSLRFITLLDFDLLWGVFCLFAFLLIDFCVFNLSLGRHRSPVDFHGSAFFNGGYIGSLHAIETMRNTL